MHYKKVRQSAVSKPMTSILYRYTLKKIYYILINILWILKKLFIYIYIFTFIYIYLFFE